MTATTDLLVLEAARRKFASAVAAAMRQFTEDTGASVTAIDVDVVTHYGPRGPEGSVITGLSVTVAVPRPDGTSIRAKL